ncbi:MAG: aa3-type cytochrome c oxidase subunit IV [Alphaproteobacteria bacterium]|nr:aa3-type cytochrome c oxidase subunit IV [Alphaproteobacteria bacterium]
MAQHGHGAATATAGRAVSPAKVSEADFVRNRERGWEGFVTFTKISIVSLVLLLVLMAVFLV